MLTQNDALKLDGFLWGNDKRLYGLWSVDTLEVHGDLRLFDAFSISGLPESFDAFIPRGMMSDVDALFDDDLLWGQWQTFRVGGLL